MVSEFKNWFGMGAHTTDSLIYWTNTEKEAKKLYEKIVKAGYLAELNILMRASYKQGRDDEHENHNEDL